MLRLRRSALDRQEWERRGSSISIACVNTIIDLAKTKIEGVTVRYNKHNGALRTHMAFAWVNALLYQDKFYLHVKVNPADRTRLLYQIVKAGGAEIRLLEAHRVSLWLSEDDLRSHVEPLGELLIAAERYSRSKR